MPECETCAHMLGRSCRSCQRRTLAQYLREVFEDAAGAAHDAPRGWLAVADAAAEMRR